MAKSDSKTWFPTKHQHLYRYKSGVYYARIVVNGKKTWRSLKTSVLGVAKAELDDLLRDNAYRTELNEAGAPDEKMTGALAITIRQRQIELSPTIKKSTRKYWDEVIRSLTQKWPEFSKLELRRVTEDQCLEWAGKYARSMSPTRFNGAVSMLRSLFDIAVKKGIRRTNPAANLKRAKVRKKDLSSRLPTKQKFSEWLGAMRAAGGRFSRPCADYVEFLAYTGLRKNEARWIEWRHCDFEKGEILVEGDPVEGTKNREFRRVPMIPALIDLLERLKQYRTSDSPTERILKVCEAQKAMDRAAIKVSMERITHHDLRHFFATICIESGVDIPTVAKWLGHKDGGALAMRVYGHLRNEHSLVAATRVSFAA